MSTSNLPIALADICIFQGATFNQTLFYETGEPSAPVNLAGFTAKMHIRSKPESKALILELSTTNGRIVLNEATGSIRLFISDSDTALLSVCDKAVYDLELYNGGVTTRILQGNVIISPEVTR
jgi:tRNA A37 threonylcarbamoyltransferase TsaD